MKKRVQPVRRKVKQLDWILKWFVRVSPCAICGIPLAEGYDARNPGKSITLHHTEGSREEDRWDDEEYVRHMVPCHVTCHRSYHLIRKHAEAGNNANTVKLAEMEANIKLALESQGA